MTIIVAGHTGLVGSAIFDALDGSNSGLIGINSKVVDLLDRKQPLNLSKTISQS